MDLVIKHENNQQTWGAMISTPSQKSNDMIEKSKINQKFKNVNDSYSGMKPIIQKRDLNDYFKIES